MLVDEQSVRGKWVRNVRYNNCGRCARCLGTRDRPHGPYLYLVRVDPTTEVRETIYLGAMELDDFDMQLVNQHFGDDLPTRQAVREMLVMQKPL